MGRSKPAGIQIKRWLLTLAILLAVVNVLSVASLFLVYRYVDDIKSSYQPIVKSSSTITEKIMGAQIDLYKYLSEYQDTLNPVFSKTKELKQEINKIEYFVKENDIKKVDLKLLNGTMESALRFEKAIQQLKETEERGGPIDWERINLLRSLAVEMGTETQNNATRVNYEINLLMRRQNIDVTMFTLVVVNALFIFFIVSILIIIQLHHWWRKFEDLILEL